MSIALSIFASGAAAVAAWPHFRRFAAGGQGGGVVGVVLVLAATVGAIWI